MRTTSCMRVSRLPSSLCKMLTALPFSPPSPSSVELPWQLHVARGYMCITCGCTHSAGFLSSVFCNS